MAWLAWFLLMVSLRFDSHGGVVIRRMSADEQLGNDYWSRIHRRETVERGVPRFLGTKLESVAYFEAMNLPHPRVVAVFDRVADIRWCELGASFVIKPTFAHSGLGVFSLERSGDRYFDALRRRFVSQSEVEDEISAGIESFGRSEANANIVVEEKVKDASGGSAAVDYKFFTFYGEIGMCLVDDKNHGPSRLAYWDGDLMSIPKGAVHYVDPGLATLVSEPPPPFMGELLDFAAGVSRLIPIPMCRVDLFMSVAGPLLGEITLLPGHFYYETRAVLSAGWSARMGEQWSRAERRIAADHGRYPLVDRDLTMEELVAAGRRRPPPNQGFAPTVGNIEHGMPENP